MLNAFEAVKKEAVLKGLLRNIEFQGLLYKIEFWEMLNTERNQASNHT